MAKSLNLGGRYTVENLEGNFLGEGGMAKVYLGKDIESGAPVAIKTLHANKFKNQPDVLERFLREGELLRQLNHPNIVKMLDSLEVDGIHYLVMEYVEGGDLNALLEKEGKLSIEQTLAIALELADALTRAHHLNIIHRDIKPGNVLLATDNTPRLTDFGIAHFDSDLSITRENEVLGTMPYLSPEGCIGEGLDVRSDVWSFGVLLYELLTGELPFGGENEIAVLASILHKELPDIQGEHPHIPDALADLIYRMLVKDPDGRIPSVRLVGAEVEGIIKGFDIKPTNETGKNLLEAIEKDSSTFETPKPDISDKKINLPAQSTRFIGRKNELEEITSLLSKSESRLVTLLGPGGMGKTRLGIEAARQLAPNYERGVHFVDLAPISDPEQITIAIAKALAIKLEEGIEPKAQLIDYFRSKQLLILMDNFEHVAKGASLIADILSESHGVKVLTTSRARLSLRDERIFEVVGMMSPENEKEETFEENEAVKLFIQHAHRARPDYELAETDKPAVMRICELAGGMPLGIQLAAGWVHTLPPKEIAEELAGDIDFLESSLQDLPERQRSMRAVFEYTWKMIPKNLRPFYVKLSVFRGGFTREAAKEIAGVGVRELATLVNHSLLQRTANGRFVVHELIRQFAENELSNDSKLLTEVRNRHWDYFADLLAKYEVCFYTLKINLGLEIFHADLDNILSGWNWAIENNRFENMKSAVFPLHFGLFFRSMFVASDSIFTKTLSALEKSYKDNNSTEIQILIWMFSWLVSFSEPQFDRIERAKIGDNAVREIIEQNLIAEVGVYFLLHLQTVRSPEFLKNDVPRILNIAENEFRKNKKIYSLCWVLYSKAMNMFWVQGSYLEAWSLFEACIKYAKEIDYGLTFMLYGGAAGALMNTGNYIKASEYFDLSIMDREIVGDNMWMILNLQGRARNMTFLGGYEEATNALEDLMLISKDIGRPLPIINAHLSLTEINILRGNYSEAHQQLAEWEIMCVELELHFDYLRLCRFYQGKLNYLENNYSKAENKLNQALQLSDIGNLEPDDRDKGMILSLLGEVHRASGNMDTAWTTFRSAIQINIEVDQNLYLMPSLIGLARWLRNDKQIIEAVEVVTITIENTIITHYDRTQAQELLAELEAKIDAKEFEKAKNKGKELTAEDIYQRYWGEEVSTG